MDAIKDAIYDLLAEEHPMTDRQLFYRLVSGGVIRKTENEYKSAVVRLVTAMRGSGEVPYDWIADNTRWMRKPRTFSCLEDAMELTARTYRRALWDDAPAYCEVWLEKEALAGVLYEVTARWDVPLMVTRGYSSVSFLHEAAETVAAAGKPTYLFASAITTPVAWTSGGSWRRASGGWHRRRNSISSEWP